MTLLKRGVIGVGLVLLLCALSFFFFQKQIAELAFDRFVKAQVGSNITAELPDGLHVFLCGTGSPLPDPTREGPCIGVLAGKKAYVFDVGSGSVRNMSLMRFPTARVKGVFLTHLHSDHHDGLGELFVNTWIGGGRGVPLPVYGPVGTAELVEGFNAAYRMDGTFRTAHHGAEIANPAGRGGRAREIATPEDPNGSIIILEDRDLKITAIRVSHEPVEPAFGYRIDYKDRSISISGDTIYHDGFVQHSEGVDIMFHEALDPEMVSRIGRALEDQGVQTGAKVFSDIPGYHATPEDAANAAQEARARALVYYHTIPPLPARLLETVFLDDAPDLYNGPITIGRDRMIFSLPAGSDEINRLD